MGKYLKKVNMKVVILLMISVISLTLVPLSEAQVENPLRPIIDNGEGYGVAPGDPTPTKTPSEQVREKQSGIIKDIFLKLFGNETNKTPLPTSAQLPTPIPTNGLTVIPSFPRPTPTIGTGDTFIPDRSQVNGCPNGSTKVNIEGTLYKHLSQQFECYPPRMFVIHWSAAWSSAQATFDVLNSRERSCQFAIDDTTTLQMLDFYEDAVQKGWCAGGDNNVGSINYEITGVYFDDVLKTPSTQNYQRLMKMTDKALSLTCKLIQKYNIPKTAIYGHYELQTGKQDPGPEYLKLFKSKVQNEC